MLDSKDLKKLRVEPYLDTVLISFPPETTRAEGSNLAKHGRAAFPHNTIVLIPRGIVVSKMRFMSVEGKPLRVAKMQKDVITLK